ncbi:MAG TPA: PhnD/SsuA/transferrin family substrate-binding protein [Candidatus Ozemobacteraceae bacterium]|nr:PhnD/SsuA/transferrin family substrate-binding protein [Candidatus Ozemobacteraceae bacterium]
MSFQSGRPDRVRHLQSLSIGAILSVLVLIVTLSHLAFGEERRQFRFACTMQTISKADQEDIRVGMDVWMDLFLKEWQLNYQSKTLFFDSLAQLIPQAKAGAVDLMNITTLQYLQLKQHLDLEPGYLGIVGSSATCSLYILVHSEKPFRSLKDLRDKTILMDSRDHRDLAAMWLDYELIRNQLPPAIGYFGKINTVSKPSEAALPVFFGEADACLIRDRAYRTLVEMNPQVGQDLLIIASSPGLIFDFCSFRAGYADPDKRVIRSSTVKFSDSVKGRQVLTLFRTDRFIPYDEQIIKPTFDLIAEAERLGVKVPVP